MYYQILRTNITRNVWKSGEENSTIATGDDTHLAQLILQVDYFCFSVLKNTTDVKVSLALPSTTRARVNLGPAEKRPEAGKQVTTRKTRTTGNTARG